MHTQFDGVIVSDNMSIRDPEDFEFRDEGSSSFDDDEGLLSSSQLEQDASMQGTTSSVTASDSSSPFTPASSFAHADNEPPSLAIDPPRYLPLERAHDQHTCPEPNCPATFPTSKQLTQHLQKKHRRYFCDVPGCPKEREGFTDRSSLRKHRLAKHEGQRYKCENVTCGREFDREDNLRRHAQTCRNRKRAAEILESDAKRRN